MNKLEITNLQLQPLYMSGCISSGVIIFVHWLCFYHYWTAIYCTVYLDVWYCWHRPRQLPNASFSINTSGNECLCPRTTFGRYQSLKTRAEFGFKELTQWIKLIKFRKKALIQVHLHLYSKQQIQYIQYWYFSFPEALRIIYTISIQIKTTSGSVMLSETFLTCPGGSSVLQDYFMPTHKAGGLSEWFD